LEVFAKAALILREKADRFELQNDVFSVFEIAIGAHLQLWEKTGSDQYLNTAFDLLEKSKAKEQLASINIANASSISGIDSLLLQTERELQWEISNQDQLVASNPKTSAAGREARSKRYQLIEQHDLLMKEFALKNNIFSKTTVQIKWLQNSFLTPQQTMLEYFVGDSNIYLFVIKKNMCYPLVLPKGRLAYYVDQLTQQGIYGYYPIPDAQKTQTLKTTLSNYTEAAVALYDLLLNDVKGGLSPELIIIPDGVLNYIPFDALLPDAPLQSGKLFTYRFLAEKHQISYCYSATMLREMYDKRHQKQPINEILGMAPFFLGGTAPAGTQYNTPSSGTFEHLYYSGAELKKIALYFPGEAFYFGANASKSIFQNQAERYRILHLSTHGEANDRNGDYSFLVFEQLAGAQKYAKLLASELYPMRLNADLVVLSACETGLGKQLRGEGIVGLSRVFSIVGAKSLVVSLWKVDSEKNATIMGDFYKYLAQKKSKDEALYLAKRDYLTNKKNEYGGSECHPFFWASFIPVGDCRALEIKK
jgi:CHAT domain-containing protein